MEIPKHNSRFIWRMNILCRGSSEVIRILQVCYFNSFGDYYCSKYLRYTHFGPWRWRKFLRRFILYKAICVMKLVNPHCPLLWFSYLRVLWISARDGKGKVPYFIFLKKLPTEILAQFLPGDPSWATFHLKF